MLPSGPGLRVYLAVGDTDMRKSMDALAALVSGRLSLDPLSGHLFAFRNRRRNLVKILYWDRNGFCLWQKRLEKDRFRWPDEGVSATAEVSWRELTWLLEGLDVRQRGAHGSLFYTAAT